MKHNLHKLFGLALVALLLSAPASAYARKKEKIKIEPLKENTSKVSQNSSQVSQNSSQDGSLSKVLFGVCKKGSDWMFDVPDSLIGREILVTVRFTSTPAGTGKYGGELANQQTVYWEKAPNGNLLLRSRLLVSMADSTDAINRAVIAANADPIIGSFKVESRQGNASRIKVTQFFMDDNQALSVSSYMKTSMGLQALLPNLSYIESIHTFPMNTEVRTTKTWMSSGRNTYASAFTGKVTLGLNVSFVLLPKNPMMPRLFDPRVGYFTEDFTQYSDNQQRVSEKRYISRWRLEPKDSADMEKMKRGELVEPKKPIVYYIDPATPKQWRPYLIAGVNDWQKAFEKAGFKNAIMAKEWPDSDSTMSMEDARYSVIRYLASDIENAYGPHISDPRSGEIIESHICWYHNVMSLVHDWYMVQASSIDEAARCMKYDTELMGQLIRFVSSHEVGHTLGLRHNFGSSSTVPVDSLRSKAFVEANGHTPSIMDYARFNYVAQPEDSIGHAGIFPRIGDYDKWAIQWGYTPMWNAYDDASDHWELEKMTSAALKNNPRLWFGDGETNRTNDPRCQTEDLGDDAVKASEYGILNLKRLMKNLPEWTYESNDIDGDNIKGMYENVLGQYLRYAGHVQRNIGGVCHDYKTIDQNGPVYFDTPKEKQLAALDYLDRNIFHEPTWLISETFVSRLSPNPEKVAASVGKSVVAPLFSSSLLERLTATYPASEYLPTVTKRLFRSLYAGSTSEPTSYERTLQRIAVDQLITTFQRGNKSDVYGTVLLQLRQLQKKCSAVPSSAHYAALADMIARALVVK